MYWFLCFILLMGVRGSTLTNYTTVSLTSTTSPTTATEGDQSSTTSNAQQHSTQQLNASEIKPKSNTPQNPKTSITPYVDNNKCTWFMCKIDPKMAVLIIGALLMTCIVLLTATLLLACKVCCTKRQVLDTTKSTPRRLSVDGESAPMISEIRKPEGDENHSGPEEQEKPEEPEKPIEEAVEATEVSNQASMEDPTLEDPTLEDLTAAESPPNQECEASETIIFDDAEQP